jgi:class 3 adenylate cyclase/tetratricopeptide (TPR) repeat protein
MQCHGCQAENRDGRRFCAKCGAALPLPCVACGFANDHTDAFCGGCGVRLTGPDRPAPAAGERRDVTVLCTDLQGYTPLSERLGEEGAYGVMDDVYKAMIAVVDEAGGTVQELTGDGILALFGAPIALEDAPMRACRAALEILARMRDVSARLEKSHGVTARVRIGLNSGPVVVATVGSDIRVELKAIGDTVNMAARMQTMAEPGSVLLSAATWRLVADAVEGDDLGERAVKGKSTPQRVFRLLRVREDAGRFQRAKRRGLVPFVARHQELETLERGWRESQDGAGRIVHLVGEAGIGKTRLVHELRGRLERDGLLFLAGHCTETSVTTPFAPFTEIVRDVFQLRADDDSAAMSRKIRQGLDVLGIDDGRVMPYLLNLLGVERDELRGQDGEIIGVHTRDALARVLRERCRLSPCLVLLDDVHWLDRSSEHLIAQFLTAGLPAGVMVVGTQRPEYRAAWADHPRYRAITLGGLPNDSLAQMVRQCAGTASDDAVANVLRAAGGNPLFVEEMSRWMADHEGALAVPSNLQGLMMARVDRLAAMHREVLQVAAVVGPRFRLDLVARVAGLNGDAGAILGDLEAMNLVARDSVDEVYTFRHGVMQDTIYQSLLTPRRRALHRRVGEAIETIYADRVSEWVDALAHHFARTDDTAKAVIYLAEAGRRSLRIYALAEADDRFRAALDLIDQTPGAVNDEVLAQIVRGWTHVYYYRRDFKGLVALVERYLPRIEALGPSRQRALLLFWLGFAQWMRMRGDDARAYTQRALELAESLGDEECIGYASMGVIYSISDTAAADVRARLDELGPRALEIAARRNDVYLASKLMWGHALVHLFAGRIALALGFARQILELGRKAGDPRTIAFGLWGSAMVLNVDERNEEALNAAEEALRVSPDPLDRLAALAAKGSALAMLGRADEALAVLESARAEVGQYDMLSILPSMDPPYGVALALAGRLAEATRWLEQIAARYEEWGSRGGVVIVRLVLGEIYAEVARRARPLPVRALVRNLRWLVQRALFAERHARSSLEAAVRICRAGNTEGTLAWGLADLALLDARRAPGRARASLEEAERLSRDLGTRGVARRIADARALIPADTTPG